MLMSILRTILLAFSMHKIAVDFLRMDEQIEHLPSGKLKVHLPQMNKPPHKTLQLCCGAHSNARQAANA